MTENFRRSWRAVETLNGKFRIQVKDSAGEDWGALYHFFPTKERAVAEAIAANEIERSEYETETVKCVLTE